MAAPTWADVRDTCFEGESGLLAVLPQSAVETYNRSLLELVLANGTRLKGFSADTPDRLRGPQHHAAWCDELAAWAYPDAWDQLQFGLRLGARPFVVATTTPRPTPLLRGLIADPRTHVTRGSTFDNAANLPAETLARLRARYEGTRLGRQELLAELLDDVPGALWTDAMFRRLAAAPDMARIVVAVDPSGASGDPEESADEIGIVVAGKTVGGEFHVIEDATCRLSPAGWGRRAAERYRAHGADVIVAERNFGGDMVAATIRTADRTANVRLVTASRGKHVRAEPVAALYEQGKVSHAPGLDRLESQMMQMTLTGFVGEGSPDRLDALVWALTELMEGSTFSYEGAL